MFPKGIFAPRKVVSMSSKGLGVFIWNCQENLVGLPCGVSHGDMMTKEEYYEKLKDPRTRNRGKNYFPLSS
jgi:hypothetical protein